MRRVKISLGELRKLNTFESNIIKFWGDSLFNNEFVIGATKPRNKDSVKVNNIVSIDIRHISNCGW